MKKYILIIFILTAQIIAAQTEGAGKYTVKNLDVKVNTRNSDFGVAFFGEDKVVFSSPKKSITLVNDVWLENKQRYLELFGADIGPDGELLNQKWLRGDINSRYHDANVVFTKDLKTVYFTRNNYYEKKLNRDAKGINNITMFKASVDEKNEWTNIQPMPFNSVDYSVGHPALSEDEKTLYFISDMPGTMGETDLYKVDINNSGYSNPINLGPKVNSTSKEFTPFIDGDILYFASDRKGGKGGLDVYAAKLVGYTPMPILLNEPINTSADDFSFIINKTSRKGYLSSKREGGAGDDDLYSFTELEPVNFKCTQLITGEVRDKNTTEVIEGANVVIKDEKGAVVDSVLIGEDGAFEILIRCETTYLLEAGMEGYTPQSKSFTTSEEADKKLKLLILLGSGDILMDSDEEKPEGLPIVLPKEIVKLRPSTYAVNIDPIYFDLNSSYLNKAAKKELDKVVELMNKYPKMVIESGSHTDSRGIPHYNDWLSDRRAKSTVSYIVNKGIDPSRITGKGYGESQLINGCKDGVKCTETEHSKNRRTEFVIIKM